MTRVSKTDNSRACIVAAARAIAQAAFGNALPATVDIFGNPKAEIWQLPDSASLREIEQFAVALLAGPLALATRHKIIAPKIYEQPELTQEPLSLDSLATLYAQQSEQPCTVDDIKSAWAARAKKTVIRYQVAIDELASTLGDGQSITADEIENRT